MFNSSDGERIYPNVEVLQYNNSELYVDRIV